MTLFLVSLAVLVGGYFIYGLFVERVIGCEPKRVMPCYSKQDGVDYMPLPTWKVFLIQFLNIAGLGPIFGAIMGVMYGPAAFLWIVFGTIFAGAVHDFLSGVISIRRDGASLPEIVGAELGAGVKQLMRVFSLALMVLVGAVFILTPAELIAGMTPGWMDSTFWIIAIFVYYMLATLLPIDKLIGNIYPVFGLALLFMAVGIMSVLIFGDVAIPDGISDGLYNRSPSAGSMPLFPMMFVSIACGAISGFHATQSPMMARCLKNERLARPVFYGAMVAEGIVALIWAAAAIAFTGGYGELSAFLSEHGGTAGLVHAISIDWLGAFGGVLAILGVVAAPITTGDTALRSARLIAADFMRYQQKTVVRRLVVSVPIFALTFFIMQIDFAILWRYFAWCNQTLAVFTLWAVTVYLARHHKFYWLTMLPALFMTCVCTSYILYAPEGLSFRYDVSIMLSLLTAAAALAWFVKKQYFTKKILSPLD
ncbi:MAG TPA: carbon starvation CstA family protein [Muribaculum sp.]|uniref:Carbon starvation CstA family protein n=1 Tax=Heminiphilus faecis TaxID=2601703 RepID=A0ABV4CWR8_9BACT|nr:carbon starvation CstA family protein [Heminiphilus faecis]RLT76787.1 carbon starvation protein A [bacterium J10(2018)]HRF68149.1 carbon starvation CstA family protein [Muribaculum sp.]